jgi:uncharacterized protein
MSAKNVSRPLGLLLPPSEGKADGGDDAAPFATDSGSFAALAKERDAVAVALRRVGGGDAKLLGVGGAHLDRARAANSVIRGAPTLPAGARYTGVVWDHLGLASLPPSARSGASDAIVVVSGLLGLVGIDDPTPDYRLKMGATLPKLGKLSTWWRPAITAALAEWGGGRFVVDLLPEEHRAAWRPEPGSLHGVSVRFVEHADPSGARVVGHDAKAAKGRLARHLLTSRAQPERALRSWRDDRFGLLITPL